ncbi:MAG: glycosyltransferase family 9 protein [Phenylobacterium sp.]|uniref:glycosyltransferase family 9 protein n=1 Tax=Phenylobacterium sp. TaxID=1871053 RepID=UPI0025D00F49|nr:glycosyltransferase family 9 protein [Phenylobacterium sp.]MCA3715490.1 glycosyltransferase family 9 protein [Phenylobacterium sp.]MCA3737107.1 glycosyltransferase family 9 protein [Phenylobacterium sp.]MCA3755733.1 glycosyltransferase family 9 protein [Phenylobacterium sp.]MCA4917130.1 glycosyltransferase family 9 protein [Phenylobacterium sp.]
MPVAPFPILFITATRIGDAVLSSGLIRRLSEEIPGARFTIVAGPAAAPLFEDVPGLDALIPLQKSRDGGHWLRLWNQVRRRSWGLVVDLRGSALSSFVRRRRRAVYRSASGPAVHKVIEAARVLGLQDDPPAPHIFVGETAARQAEALVAGEGPILALGPAANWIGKTWPIERFAQAAIQLLGPGGPLAGGRLLVAGGPQDAGVLPTLRSVAPRGRFIDLVGKVDLVTLHAALGSARLFIGNDSGVMHLAAAAGAPTLGLFGPSDERLYAPWGDRGRVLRGARSLDQIRTLDPDLRQAICHMMDLSVDSVVAAARRLVTETEAPRPAQIDG